MSEYQLVSAVTGDDFKWGQLAGQGEDNLLDNPETLLDKGWDNLDKARDRGCPIGCPKGCPLFLT
ncbi:hypothetical protein H1P_3330007 [Hyella patelloides LEGE 07179]|uniref:Uncharacterized protein n=1 Tax=Hyella patelloides LEGE 07179 TaxID=945734 RepID=A0A563VVF9_9CYAN|nr:hypothetical protein [Hyella patelloides]VEP15422.1 hypothetical protein H1P_3330007 [Hyella patelloides LEGE 07179]